MDLVRDLLDTLVVDRNGREMGRVDTIVLDVRDGAPPEVVALELGPAVLAYRLGPWLGRLVAGIEHAFEVDAGRPVRVRLKDVLSIHNHVKVDLAFGETGAATIESRLRRWVGSLPRSS